MGSALASSEKRNLVLRAPLIPFDGINEYGLTVGMAAVPGSPGPAPAPGKQTIGSLRIIRLMLDHAITVDEATAVIRQYNIDAAPARTAPECENYTLIVLNILHWKKPNRSQGSIAISIRV